MNWEANLATIIKCTDASLAQQFREFGDVTAEFTSFDEAPAASVHDHSSDNVAAAYLRKTMAAEYRHRQQEQEPQQQTRVQTPSYSRVSGAFTRGSRVSTTPTTFSEHFHRRQEQKRGAATATGRAKDNQRMHCRYDPAEEESQVQDQVNEPHYATSQPAAGSYHQQMYTSPTYDMAQMMEQVRLSLKLEVDARAAIAERQLSALLQLCKATSEELDRLRVEVCANDRQLHTLDQVQSKIRQELTTQKDIGFHLQSMCGKDESWRMQTENQMLELRQMVAALREQGNSTQAVAQEKLSRSELLVQFNAAMEPIKAQLQANIQHQAQQIADITRTTSSSSLLLDGITQKVNRGITDELNELRSDLSALKHHVAKMDIFQDGGRGEGPHGRTPQISKEELEAKAKEELQQQEKKMTDLREGLQKELVTFVHDYVDAQTKSIRQMVDESSNRFIGKHEIQNLRDAFEEGCRNRAATTGTQLDSKIKSAHEQLQAECNATIRDTSDRLERSMQQTASAMKTSLEELEKSCQNKQLEFAKRIEQEQKERKQALDELHGSVRKSRHQLEDQIHTLNQESRAKLSQHYSDLEKRLKDMEKQIESAVVDLQKESQDVVENMKSFMQTQGGNHTLELEQKIKRLEETVSSTNVTVANLSKFMATLATTSSSAPNSDSTSKDFSLALEKQTSAMENMFKKIQLQLQLQARPQVQMTNDLALSVPSPAIVSTGKNETPPPPSPLAKLFARPTPEEVTQVDSGPVQTAPSGNFAPVVDSAKTAPEQNNVQIAPTTPSASSTFDGGSISHVLCDFCRLPVRSDLKTEHEKSQCPKRMVECVSCKKQIQWVSLEIHELECNSVETKEIEADTKSSPIETKPIPDTTELGGSLKKCRHCSANVPNLDLLEHEINCDKVLKQCPHCLRRQKMSELQDHIENCDCRLVSCPNDCGGKFLQRGIPNHLATRCPKKSVATPVTVSTPVSRPANPEASKPIPPPPAIRPSTAPTPTGKVECKFCDDEIDASKIDDHEQNCDWKPKRCQHCNMVVISRDLQRHETSCKTNVKSCPHCNENMLQSALATHASLCLKRPIKCIRCCQLFPADAIVAHSTNCKFVPGTNPQVNSPLPQQTGSQQVASMTPIKIPPPPPFPPPPSATTPVPASQQNTRCSSADPQIDVTNTANTIVEETASDRLARRNLALSQLMNREANPLTNVMQHERNTVARASSPSMYSTTSSSRPIIRPDHEEDEDEEDEDEDEYDDEDDDDQLTLAQVVKEWSVENVCLWLHEDVGVPDVVLRFQQKQCNGEMLLELTESDLINDYGVRDRVQRERILSAIEAINTSNAFSDEDEEDNEEEDDDNLEESEENGAHDSASNSTSSRMHHSLGGATFSHPRDILRRKSQPSPKRALGGGELPSSNDMLRRITSALENPKR